MCLNNNVFKFISVKIRFWKMNAHGGKIKTSELKLQKKKQMKINSEVRTGF